MGRGEIVEGEPLIAAGRAGSSMTDREAVVSLCSLRLQVQPPAAGADACLLFSGGLETTLMLGVLSFFCVNAGNGKGAVLCVLFPFVLEQL